MDQQTSLVLISSWIAVFSCFFIPHLAASVSNPSSDLEIHGHAPSSEFPNFSVPAPEPVLPPKQPGSPDQFLQLRGPKKQRQGPPSGDLETHGHAPSSESPNFSAPAPEPVLPPEQPGSPDQSLQPRGPKRQKQGHSKSSHRESSAWSRRLDCATGTSNKSRQGPKARSQSHRSSRRSPGRKRSPSPDELELALKKGQRSPDEKLDPDFGPWYGERRSSISPPERYNSPEDRDLFWAFGAQVNKMDLTWALEDIERDRAGFAAGRAYPSSNEPSPNGGRDPKRRKAGPGSG